MWYSVNVVKNKEIKMNESIKNNIIETLDNLQKNAIFRLSLTSKELFHSNFLAWIF